MIKLPSNPSALLRLAVRDAKKIEHMPGYKLNMFRWHMSNGHDVCEVCLAGSVMVCTLKVPRHEYKRPEDFEDFWTIKALFLIDKMREGDFSDLKPSNELDKISLFINKHYNIARGRAPWWVYLKAADRLKRLGL